MYEHSIIVKEVMHARQIATSPSIQNGMARELG